MLHHNELFISCGLKATSLEKQFYAYYFSYRYRGYYKAARGYEFYLLMLKVSLTSEPSERVRDTFSTRT